MGRGLGRARRFALAREVRAGRRLGPEMAISSDCAAPARADEPRAVLPQVVEARVAGHRRRAHLGQVT